MRWIEARCGELAPDGALQVMYGIDGRHLLTEESLVHWEGYQRSTPVRIGNGAYNQLQLDIYGELMDAVYLYNKYGAPISHDLWMNLTRLLNWVCDHWHLPDAGIWEVRGGLHEFLHSRLLCWVALDRGIRLASKRSFPAPLARWGCVRDQIYHEVFTHFWDPQRQAFVQYKGATTLDAASLLMPLLKFISPTDPRWLASLRATEEVLVTDSLVYRYKTGDTFQDGLLGDEGTFSMCSFWYVECLARAGDLNKPASSSRRPSAMRTIWASMPSNWDHAANTWGIFPRHLPTSPCGQTPQPVLSHSSPLFAIISHWLLLSAISKDSLSKCPSRTLLMVAKTGLRRSMRQERVRVMDNPPGSLPAQRRTTLVAFLVAHFAMVIAALMILPYVLAVTMGGILALLSHPVFQWLKGHHVKPRVAAAVVVLGVVLVLIAPLSFFVTTAIQQGHRHRARPRRRWILIAIPPGPRQRVGSHRDDNWKSRKRSRTRPVAGCKV